MNIKTNPALNEQDLRLNLFLGIANWCIFLDHVPDNVVNLITVRNFGFSGAADWFIFISGYSAAIIFARIELERGAIVGSTRILKRGWQLYAAYIVLFVSYIVSIGTVAAQYSAPDLINEFNVVALIDHPIRILGHGLLLQTRALNLDVLQLYTLLMLLFAPVLWLMLRKPDLTMSLSVALYFSARWFDWNLPSFPDGYWYFNPFCWQLLFVFGAWLAIGKVRTDHPVLESPVMLYLAIAYLIVALIMTMAARIPDFGELFPAWVSHTLSQNDRANLPPYRVLHFTAAVFVANWFVSKNWPGLRSLAFDPLIKCGEQSLPVFCAGVFLAFIGHFMLMISSGSVLTQIMVSATGIAIMTLVAYYVSWSKQQDKWKTLAPA